ncbi:MAG TPA: S9 family peptidase [Candidatus Limnocylindrales bacterium]
MTASDRRAPRPDDLYRIVIPTGPRLSPDGSRVAFTVQRARPTFEGYATALWVAPTDGSQPARPVTLGARHDGHARWSPDGRRLAFLSDRRPIVEEEPTAPKEREDGTQIHLLPIDGPGEARRLTDLPRGVDTFEWSPDGKTLAVLSASVAATKKADDRARQKAPDAAPGTPPASDYRFADRLHYQQNGAGFTEHRTSQVWLVDAESGEARRLTSLLAGVDEIAWSPDGKRLAITTRPARDYDLRFRLRVLSLDVASGKLTPVAEHPDGVFFSPTWLPDGKRIAVLGGYLLHVAYRNDIWLFTADGSQVRRGTDLSSRHDVMAASNMNSDLTIAEGPRLMPTPNGSALLFLAPYRGANELWRISTSSGDLERLTDGKQYLSSFDAVPAGGSGSTLRLAAIRSTPVELPDVVTTTLPAGGKPKKLEPLTDLNRNLLGEVELRAPVERWVKVDGHQVQGWLIPAGDGPRPTVLEIHGGPHTLYGWSPFWEFQVLAGAGMSVAYANPRGSEGYGLEFNEGNINDWGPGPTRDVLGVVDAFVADGLADPDRLGVTGGSYGGYLTSWIVGHDQRFKAALTARSVNDLGMLFLTGDLGGTEWPSQEFGAWTWDDPERFRLQSPLTYADAVRTPLLIQHAEKDIRTTMGQAEVFFNRLRRLRRPVRLMRVPDESHELTRSGTPFRRVENLVQVRDWFSHFLVAGKRRLPPKPRTRFGS